MQFIEEQQYLTHNPYLAARAKKMCGPDELHSLPHQVNANRQHRSCRSMSAETNCMLTSKID